MLIFRKRQYGLYIKAISVVLVFCVFTLTTSYAYPHQYAHTKSTLRVPMNGNIKELILAYIATSIFQTINQFRQDHPDAKLVSLFDVRQLFRPAFLNYMKEYKIDLGIDRITGKICIYYPDTDSSVEGALNQVVLNVGMDPLDEFEYMPGVRDKTVHERTAEVDLAYKGFYKNWIRRSVRFFLSTIATILLYILSPIALVFSKINRIKFVRNAFAFMIPAFTVIFMSLASIQPTRAQRPQGESGLLVDIDKHDLVFEKMDEFSTYGGLAADIQHSDLNGDGIDEVVLATDNSIYIFEYKDKHYELDWKSENLREKYKSHIVAPGVTSIAIEDVDGDRVKELVAGINGCLVVFEKASEGYEGSIVDWFGYGNEVWDVTVSDFDGDGIGEIAAGTCDTSHYVNIYKYDKSQQKYKRIWFKGEEWLIVTDLVALGLGRVYSLIGGDINGDGKDELVINHWGRKIVQIFEYVNGRYQMTWESRVLMPHLALESLGLTIGDPDGDAKNELVVTGQSAGVHIIGYSKTEGYTEEWHEPYRPYSEWYLYSYQRAEISDIDGDGVGEIIVLTGGQGPSMLIYKYFENTISYGVIIPQGIIENSDQEIVNAVTIDNQGNLIFTTYNEKDLSATKIYFYTSSVESIVVQSERPRKDMLFQNYPNPFGPGTWIPYQLFDPADVTVQIYNQKGQIIRTLDLGHKNAGYYISRDDAAYWDGRDDEGEQMASGVYFYTIKVKGKFIEDTKKMVKIKTTAQIPAATDTSLAGFLVRAAVGTTPVLEEGSDASTPLLLRVNEIREAEKSI